MDIADWRKKIDEIDRKLVTLINERAHAAQEIGRIKRVRNLPVYEAERERVILQKICDMNQGPLSNGDLTHVYERLIEVMRAIQKVEPESDAAPAPNSGKRSETASKSRR